TGFGLAALLGVVGVGASPPFVSSVQERLTALRARVGDMTTQLGRIAERADQLRVQVGEWPLTDRDAPTAVDRARRPPLALPDRLRAIDVARSLPERQARTDSSELPRGQGSRELRATMPDAPSRQPRTTTSDLRASARGADGPPARPAPSSPVS